MTLSEAPAGILEQLAAVDVSQDPHKDIGPLGEGVWIGILGPKRSGKGLMATNMALQAALRGVRVFHFGNLNFGEKIDDALTLLERDPNAFRNCLIVFDEAKAHAMSQRANATVMLLFDNIMTQSGHFNVSVIWTTTTQRGLHPVFTEQTHFVYWIDHFGVKKEPLFDRRPAGMNLYDGWRQNLTNKCEGWFDPELDGAEFGRRKYAEFHQGPPGLIDCRKALVAIRGELVPGKHTIRWKLTSQASSRWGAAGLMELGGLYCAHRFYRLNQTDAFISSLAMATTTASDVRQAASINQVELVAFAIREMVESGREKAFPYDVTDWMRKRYEGAEMSEARCGNILAAQLGVETVKKSARGRPNRRSGYNIAQWVAEHPEEELEDAGEAD